jgi:phospholipid-binding lipoprotein MlaA
MRGLRIVIGLWIGLLVAAAPALAVEPVATAPEKSAFHRYDPWERANRHIYYWNARMDRWVMLPVANFYAEWTPNPVRQGIGNFFENMNEVPNFYNNILQAEWDRAAISLSRFIVNTSIGVLGIFDVAHHLDLEAWEEDFGQTLGVWGVPPGPYLVLPVFGPSSVRDSTGLVVDRLSLWGVEIAMIGSFEWVLSALYPLELIEDRAGLSFRYGELGPFEYDIVRTMYLDYREALIADER